MKHRDLQISGANGKPSAASFIKEVAVRDLDYSAALVRT